MRQRDFGVRRGINNMKVRSLLQHKSQDEPPRAFSARPDIRGVSLLEGAIHLDTGFLPVPSSAAPRKAVAECPLEGSPPINQVEHPPTTSPLSVFHVPTERGETVAHHPLAVRQAILKFSRVPR